MLTVANVHKELLNENASEVTKELCHKFLKEKTLSWAETKREREHTLCDSSSKIAADIIQDDSDPLGPEFHTNCSHPSKPFTYMKFSSFAEAIKFVTFEFIKAGFIVLPPSFEV